VTSQIDPNHQAVDLGIVIRDWAATKAFYVDTLGFEHTSDMAFPIGAGGTMHRVQAGSTTLKLSEMTTTPTAVTPAGPIDQAIGVRYFTFWVKNLDEVFAAVTAKGYKTPVKITTVRPGVRIFMVVDPDGTWVELLQVD
jgi:catechol 2,3-dioxygenase-like lactoylglutathione lyase family enzyme